jgi:hypothetical protein
MNSLGCPVYKKHAASFQKQQKKGRLFDYEKPNGNILKENFKF